MVYQIDRFIELAPFRVKRFGAPMGLKENTIRNYRGLKRILSAFENFRGAPIYSQRLIKNLLSRFLAG